MEKRYTVRQAVTMTGVKSYVLRYWEEELDLRIGRNELGHRYYTPFDIQLFLKINELKNRGLQLKAIRTLIPQEARNTYPSDLAKTGSEILEGEAVEIEDIPVGTPEEAAEDMFMEKQKTSKEHREDDKKILEFQEILERLIHEEMQRKKENTGVVLWMKPSERNSRQEERRQLPVMEKRIKETEKAAGKPAASFVTVAYQANGALLSRDSTNWTGLSACSAVNTSVCVDYIMLISLRNSFVRALTLACSTANALVRNYICHN